MSEGVKHYPLDKYLDVILEKSEIVLSKTDFEINPGITFHFTVTNNSDVVVELDRFFLDVSFKLPLKEGGEDFVRIGKGYAIVKNILDAREKRHLPILFEIPHGKAIAIQKVMHEAKSIDGKLIVFAYFMRFPSGPYMTLPVSNPQNVRAWSELPDFPPLGCIVKEYDFTIPIDKWEEFVERVRSSL